MDVDGSSEATTAPRRPGTPYPRKRGMERAVAESDPSKRPCHTGLSTVSIRGIQI